MVKLVAAFLIAYFIGNISPSTIIARAHGIDIKKEGSGNAGTTNALRVLGKKAAAITLSIDICKGVAAVLIGMLLAGQTGAMGCALCVMLGHIWPIAYRFRGGKGVATSFGALLVINPLLALLELAITAVVTLLSKRVSAGSIAGIVCLPFMCMLMEPEFTLVAAVISIIMLVKHRANIVRLIHGEEPVLGFFEKGKKKDGDPGTGDTDVTEDIDGTGDMTGTGNTDRTEDHNIEEDKEEDRS